MVLKFNFDIQQTPFQGPEYISDFLDDPFQGLSINYVEFLGGEGGLRFLRTFKNSMGN